MNVGLVVFAVIMNAFFLIAILIFAIILYRDYRKSEAEKEKWKEIELEKQKVEADLFQLQLKKRRAYIERRSEFRDKYDKIMREKEHMTDETKKEI